MHPEKKRTVFVTGGTGLIGAHLLSDLVKEPVHVRALKRSGSNLDMVRKIFRYYHEDAEAQCSKIEWVNGSLLSPGDLQASMQGASQVYHCAGMVSFDPRDRQELFQANVGGTAAIVDHCLRAGIDKLCYISSSSTLGKPLETQKNTSIDENTPWDADAEMSDYARSKYQAEQEVWNGVREGLSAVILNPSIVIGPGDWNRSSSKLFRTIWKGFPFYSSGVNAFVDVRDVAKAARLLMESPLSGERFVVSAENLPFKQVFDSIADHLNKRRPFLKVSPLLGEMAWRLDWLSSKWSGKSPQITRSTVLSARMHSHFSNEKIRQHLKMSFMPIEKSIEDTSRLFLLEH